MGGASFVKGNGCSIGFEQSAGSPIVCAGRLSIITAAHRGPSSRGRFDSRLATPTR